MKKFWFIIVFFTLIIQSETKSDHSNVAFSSGEKVAYSSDDFVIFEVKKRIWKIPQLPEINQLFRNGAHRYCSKHRKDTYLFYKLGKHGDYYDSGNINNKFSKPGVRFICANTFNEARQLWVYHSNRNTEIFTTHILAVGFQQYITSELKYNRLERIIYEDEKREILEAKKKEEEKRLAEEKRIAEEEKRIAEEEKKIAEEERIAEEKRAAEEERIAEENKKKEEEKKIADLEKRYGPECEENWFGLVGFKKGTEEYFNCISQKYEDEEKQRIADAKNKENEQERIAEEKRIAEAKELEKIAKEKKGKQEDKKDSSTIVVNIPRDLIYASSGTGFFISRDGKIVTNYHVIDRCELTTVSISGDEYMSKTLAVDKINDLAIIKISKKPKKIYPVSKDDPKLLQSIIIAGFPLGKQVSAVIKTSRGSVTALAGFQDNYSEFQTDAALNKGNSGGPIIDLKGNVIGVAVAAVGKDQGVESFNFGIKSSTLKTFASANGVNFKSPGKRELSNERLSDLIIDATVFISCFMNEKTLREILREADNKKAIFSEHE